MRLAVISDVHANLEALRAALASIAAEGVDRILCLGDIVGYHADPGECIALLRRSGAICVLGNHDGAVAGRTATDGFSADAARGVARGVPRHRASSTSSTPAAGRASRSAAVSSASARVSA